MAPAVGAIALTAVPDAAPARGREYTWPVTRVIDGDTVEVEVPGLPPELTHIRVRLRGVDTPEKNWRAQCPSEREAGRAATAFTVRQIGKARRIVVRDPKWGTYGGRVIADLVLDGRSLSDALIEVGHGVRDHGAQTKEERQEKKWKRWCSEPET